MLSHWKGNQKPVRASFIRRRYRLTFLGQMLLIILALIIGFIIGITVSNVSAEAESTEELPRMKTLEAITAVDVPIVYSDEYLEVLKGNVTLMEISREDTPEIEVMEDYVEAEPVYNYEYEWGGDVLNRVIGTVYGPSGRETYYNLPMGGVVSIMRNLGYSEQEYPYWEREDGAKMLGPYIMCAADLGIYERGSVIPCSMGTCIVADTGEFTVNGSGVSLDIAVTW